MLETGQLVESVNVGDFDSYVRANQWVLIADVESTTVTNKAYWEGVCANRGDMLVQRHDEDCDG